jgi:hypothetical protein
MGQCDRQQQEQGRRQRIAILPRRRIAELEKEAES